MNLLAIDTSTDVLSIALSHNNQILEKHIHNMKTHGLKILPMINSLLNEGDLSIENLDGIVFGRGPGSFTGLRISCSVAKGLAFAHDLPLYPVSTLRTIAEQALTEEPKSNVLAVIDARMHQLYWGFFPAITAEEHVSNPEDVADCKSDSIILAGVGFEPYFSNLPVSLQKKIYKQLNIYPEAARMIKLVLDGAITPVSATEALPVYIRNNVAHGVSNG